MTAEVVELASGAARLTLLPATGGAIVGLTLRDRDVLRPTPADARTAGGVRRAACYPLVPYSNRIRDARFRVGRTEHALARNFGDHPHAIHGVGWQRAWRTVRADASRALLAFEHRDDRTAWPWPFRATQSFDLTGSEHAVVLETTLTIENAGDTTFPFGLGWHPFFPRDASTTLAFAARDVWLNDATQLPVDRVAVAARYDFTAARDPGAETIDNVFGGWSGRAVISSPARGLTTRIAADRACDRLVVYAPAGRGFVAVEPVTHETDAFNRAADGAASTGMRLLPPGAAFSCTMRVGAIADR